MSYLLLTGATGLLGSYLIRDLTRKGVRLAVVVRRTKFATAKQRIEDCMVRWERIAGHSLPRPVVLEGNITSPDFGLSEDEIKWVTKHCDSLMHNAASLTFQAESPEGEPWASNVKGTQVTLDFCKTTGITDFHHVSTAYVCGLRDDIAKEDELDVGQELGNDYETSKMQAEKLVRTAEHIKTVTCYRPAIIIGDSKTGYTSTFHGFYVPLKILSSLVSKTVTLGFSKEELQAVNKAGSDRLRELLNMDGSEHKNYVPVDWVSEVMAHIYAENKHHGKTYHLTPRNRVPVSQMQAVFEDSFTEQTVVHSEATEMNIDWNNFEKYFVEQMEVYKSYWKDDPHFDYTNTTQAAPHLPCPIVDEEMLEKMCRFAMESNFGWPRPKSEIAENDLHDLFQKNHLSLSNNHSKVIANIEINGPGGGQWKFLENDDQSISLEEGIDSNVAHSIYMNTTTFNDLLNGRLTIEESITTGNLLFEGSQSLDHLLNLLFENLVGQVKQLALVNENK